MKTQTYLLTKGRYEPIPCGCVVGPARPAMSTLWKKYLIEKELDGAFDFYDKFGDYTSEMLQRASDVRYEFEVRMGHTIELDFVMWLIMGHKFQPVDYKQFHLS